MGNDLSEIDCKLGICITVDVTIIDSDDFLREKWSTIQVNPVVTAVISNFPPILNKAIGAIEFFLNRKMKKKQLKKPSRNFRIQENGNGRESPLSVIMKIDEHRFLKKIILDKLK